MAHYYTTTPTITMTVWAASSTDVTGLVSEADISPTSKMCGACGRVCGRTCAGWVAHRLRSAADAARKAKLAAELEDLVREMLRDAKRWKCGRLPDRLSTIKVSAPNYSAVVPMPRARCVSGERTHRPSHRRFRAGRL